MSIRGRAVLTPVTGIARCTCATLTLLLIGLAGCQQPEPILYPLTGTVVYQNRPAAGAKVVFHPQFEGPGWMPVATADDHGAFEAGTKVPGDGALPGKYIVTVTWPEDPENEDSPNRLPQRYAAPQTSGLVVEAGPDAPELPTFNLTD